MLIIIIILIIINSITISFVALLNCFCLNPRVSLLSISPPHLAGGEGEG